MQKLRKMTSSLFLTRLLRLPTVNTCMNFEKKVILVRSFSQNSHELDNAPQTLESREISSSNVAHITSDTFKLAPFFYYRAYLENNMDFYTSVFIKSQLSVNRNINILKVLHRLNDGFSNSEVTFKELLDCMEKELCTLTFDEFLVVLHEFLEISYRTNENNSHLKRNKNVLEIVKCLNNECFQRSYVLSIDDNLKLIDVMSNSCLFLKFNFTWKKVLKFCHKPYQLNHQQIVHLIHLLSKFHKPPSNELKFSLQNLFHEIVPQCNLNELGIIFTAIFKMKLFISHPSLLSDIIKRATSFIDDFNSNILFSASVALLHVGLRNEKSTIIEFQNKLSFHVNKFSIYSLVHLISSGINCSYVNENLFMEVLEKVKENVEKMDLFYIGRIIFLSAKFRIKDDIFLKMALEIMLSKKELNLSILVFVIKYLICLGVYNDTLFERVLSNDVFNYFQKQKSLSALINLKYIDTSIEIDYHSYDGPRLTQKQNSVVWRLLKTQYYLKLSNMYSLDVKGSVWNNLEKIIDDIYGKNFTAWMKVLPHQPHIVLMKFNKNLEAQPINKKLLECDDLNIYRLPNDDHIWMPIVFITSRHVGVTGEINYIVQTYFDQLNTMGYKPLQILYSEWCKLPHNEAKECFQALVKSNLQKHLEEAKFD